MTEQVPSAGSGPAGPSAPWPGVGPRPGPVAAPPPHPVPREAWQRPRRVEPIAGTPYGMVYLEVPPVTSGLAVGALVAGAASVLIGLIVACFGLLGRTGGWGGWAAGAFAVLGGFAGLAGVGLGELGQRQIRRPAPPPAVRFTGRRLALAGLICGAAGLALTVLAFLTAVFLQLA